MLLKQTFARREKSCFAFSFLFLSCNLAPQSFIKLPLISPRETKTSITLNAPAASPVRLTLTRYAPRRMQSRKPIREFQKIRFFSRSFRSLRDCFRSPVIVLNRGTSLQGWQREQFFSLSDMHCSDFFTSRRGLYAAVSGSGL